jgi:hypothetical protein
VNEPRISCRHCGEDFTRHPDLLASHAPCPSCESQDRHIEVSDSATVHEDVALTARDERGRWFVKLKTGHEFFHLTQRWHDRYRRLDRSANRYVEHISDAETGEEIRSVDERLTDHRGRGSAKKRKPGRTT